MASLSYIDSEKLLKLIKRADPGGTMKCFVVNNRLAIGVDPLNPIWAIDFSAEAIQDLGDKETTLRQSASQKRVQPVAISRRSGTYSFKLKGQRHLANSLKQLLRDALLAIEKEAPGTLEKLSQIKPYSKRIVARDPKLLFEATHLSDEFSEELGNGWWFGTNNSAQEVRAWLERAANCANLTWGEEITLGD